MTMIMERTAIRERPGKKLLTAADVARLPSDLPSGPVRYELWDGELVIMTLPAARHGNIAGRIATLLGVHGDFAGLGQVVSGDAGILLSVGPDTLVGADVAFLTNAQLPPKLTSQGWLITIPALVVEVVSKNDGQPASQRKVDRYLQAGVQVVWVADSKKRTLTIHKPGEAPNILAEGDALTGGDMLPALSFPMGQLFQ